MNPFSRTIAVLLACAASTGTTPAGAAAQAPWQPSTGHTQVMIWPGAAPNARPSPGRELSAVVTDSSGRPKLVGGRPWVYVDSVSQPTMTVYAPTTTNTGAAVLVFPGGGYGVLAIDLEGSEACDWLTAKGITCVLLKYRVPCVKTGPYSPPAATWSRR
jgi:acetyl esterase/lipase